VDRLLRILVSRAARRGFGGEPIWLAVAAAAWLVGRSRNRRDEVAWSGRLQPGERLVIAVADPGAPAPVTTGGE
jgi:hypothetical protein